MDNQWLAGWFLATELHAASSDRYRMLKRTGSFLQRISVWPWPGGFREDWFEFGTIRFWK